MMFYTKCNVIHGVNVTVVIFVTVGLQYMLHPYWYVHAYIWNAIDYRQSSWSFVCVISVIKSLCVEVCD